MTLPECEVHVFRLREAGLWSVQLWNQFDMSKSRVSLVIQSESTPFEVFSTHLANFPLLSSGQFYKSTRDKLSAENGLMGRAIPAPSAGYKEIWND